MINIFRQKAVTHSDNRLPEGLVLFLVLGLFLIYSLFSWGSGINGKAVFHVLVAGILVAVYFVYVCLYQGQSLFSPGMVYILYVLLMNLSIPLLLLVNGSHTVPYWYLDEYRGGYFLQALIAINLYLFSFLISTIILYMTGLWLRNKTAKSFNLREHGYIRTAVIIFFLLSVGYALYRLMGEGISLGMTYHLYRVSLRGLGDALYGLRFAFYFLVVSTVGKRSDQVKVMALVLFAVMGGLALIGERSQFFFPFLTYLVVYQREIGLKRRNKVLLIMAIPVSFFLIGWIKESRHIGAYTLSGVMPVDTMLSALGEMGASLTPLIFCIRYVDLYGPMYGYSFAIPVLRWVSERIPFVETIDFTLGGNIVSEIFTGYSFGFNAIGEQYLNGGFWAVLIGAALTAYMVYAVAYDRSSPYRRIFWGITYWYLLYVVRNSYTGWFGTLLINILFVFAVKALVNIGSRDRKEYYHA